LVPESLLEEEEDVEAVAGGIVGGVLGVWSVEGKGRRRGKEAA